MVWSIGSQAWLHSGITCRLFKNANTYIYPQEILFNWLWRWLQAFKILKILQLILRATKCEIYELFHTLPCSLSWSIFPRSSLIVSKTMVKEIRSTWVVGLAVLLSAEIAQRKRILNYHHLPTWPLHSFAWAPPGHLSTSHEAHWDWMDSCNGREGSVSPARSAAASI